MPAFPRSAHAPVGVPAEAPSTQLAAIAGIAVVVFTAIRLLAAGQFELLPEEAYYWTYFEHPALSYFDHPPMVAWVVGLGVTLFGHTEFGVRCATIALSCVSSTLVFAITRLWFGNRSAIWATVLFNVLPTYLVSGFFTLPDGPLISFWLLALLGITQAATRNRASGWVWVGVGIGGALLSKYTAAMLVPGLFAFLWLHPGCRHWLRRPQPWLALGLAALMFAPVVVWNAGHDWASFVFQGARLDDAGNDMATSVATFWLYQFAAVTPPVMLLFARGVLRRDGAATLAQAFALPLLALFLYASFRTEVRFNWTAPAYLALLPAAGALAADYVRTSRPWRLTAGATTVVIATLVAAALSAAVWGRPALLASTRIGGWQQLAIEVERAEHELEARTGREAFILGADRYNLAAELGFYTNEPEAQVNTFALGAGGLGFRYWTRLANWEGHPAVAVLTQPRRGTLDELRANFAAVEQPRRVEVAGTGTSRRVAWLVNCHGYHAPR
ncbi:MAG: glycosyltransferase family 39 protein [Myxococcales bacterium]|nr:glycosyltransferase family 39 protein [Myxococcales bacterium]